MAKLPRTSLIVDFNKGRASIALVFMLHLRPAGGDPGLDHLQNIFLTVCVSLGGLGPSETHEKLSMRKMCDSSNEKQGEKLFLL